MSEVQEKRMLSLIDQSVQKAESIDPEFLAWLDKDLPTAYRDKFIEGQKLYAEGIRKGDPMMQIKGNELMMQWHRYWVTNKAALLDKMYPE